MVPRVQKLKLNPKKGFYAGLGLIAGRRDPQIGLNHTSQPIRMAPGITLKIDSEKQSYKKFLDIFFDSGNKRKIQTLRFEQRLGKNTLLSSTSEENGSVRFATISKMG